MRCSVVGMLAYCKPTQVHVSSFISTSVPELDLFFRRLPKWKLQGKDVVKANTVIHDNCTSVSANFDLETLLEKFTQCQVTNPFEGRQPHDFGDQLKDVLQRFIFTKEMVISSRGYSVCCFSIRRLYTKTK